MSVDGLRKQIEVRVIFDDRAPCRREVSAVRPSGCGRRIGMCVGLFSLIFAVMTGRLAQISLFSQPDEYLASVREQPEQRREVTDRDGRPLIMNATLTGMAIDGRDVWDVEEVVKGVNSVLPHVNSQRLRERLSGHQYAHIVDSISSEERAAIIQLSLPGISFQETSGRIYPQKDLAAHLAGYTIPGRGGAIGVEAALDGGQFGGDNSSALRLSLDLVAQQILEEELMGAIENFSAKAGWGVLMDVRSGEVIALASLPDFNPNRPGGVSADHWRNRVMSDRYELGSAFKPITIAAALEQGSVDMGTRFDVSRPIDVGGWSIADYSRKKPVLTLSEVVQYSSNIGTVQVARQIGVEKFSATLAELGLTEELRTELPETRKPSYSEVWRPAELASVSYGHGIAVTPLQLTAAFSAVVNGGHYHKPTFVADTTGQVRKVFSEDTSQQMRIMLRRAVTDGTGRNADVDGFYVIGKTATADKPVNGAYDEENGELISSFIGAFPGYDPQYVLLVSVDEPEGTKATYGYATAGYVAAPVFRRVVERAAPALGVMPVGDDVAFDGFLGLRRNDMVDTDQHVSLGIMTDGALH